MRHILPLLLAAAPGAALACSPCRAQVRAQLFSDDPGAMFFYVIAPVMAVALGALLLEAWRDGT